MKEHFIESYHFNIILPWEWTGLNQWYYISLNGKYSLVSYNVIFWLAFNDPLLLQRSGVCFCFFWQQVIYLPGTSGQQYVMTMSSFLLEEM